ncbi:MAG: NAD-binding protein, partial [Alphaproteobacteria bacterium]|nr:NAD-binding protein [Alphaproteobacteria bacterium]
NTIAAVAEGLLLAAAGGADPVAVREALSGGFADSRILQEHGKRMLEGNFQPGGKVTTQLKDLNTALEAVKDIDLPVTKLVRDLYSDAAKGELASLDHSAILCSLETRNKTKLRS